MPAAAKNDARLEFRVNRRTKKLIEHAASLSGRTMNDFATAILVENAERVVRNHGATVLGDRDRDVFLALLDADGRPNRALKQAAAKYRKLYG